MVARKSPTPGYGAESGDRACDEGVGFDPSQLGDPLDPENLMRPNGRGIFYMRSFMDDITYGSGPGGGTMVTLRKRFTGPKTDPDSTKQDLGGT